MNTYAIGTTQTFTLRYTLTDQPSYTQDYTITVNFLECIPSTFTANIGGTAYGSTFYYTVNEAETDIGPFFFTQASLACGYTETYTLFCDNAATTTCDPSVVTFYTFQQNGLDFGIYTTDFNQAGTYDFSIMASIFPPSGRMSTFFYFQV